MKPDLTQELLDSLRQRGEGAPASRMGPLAGLLVAARREEIEEDPVPRDLRRRIVAIGAGAPRTGLHAAARWLFDSWSDLSPAMRGRVAPRLLRYEDALGGVDVEVEEVSATRVRLRIAVDDPEDVERVVILDPEEKPVHELQLNERGTADLTLERPPVAVVVVLEGAGVEWMRTPSIQLPQADG